VATTAYHAGEHAVQERAGLAQQAAFSLGGIGDSVPEVAAAFLAGQPFIVFGARDPEGRMWASQLTGAPGFLHAPDPRTVAIRALPIAEDPLAGVLGTGPAQVGMIAIEPASRRRMRINGTAVPDGDGLLVSVDQVIANCPKYIQKRTPHQAPPGRDTGPAGAAAGSRAVTTGTRLSPDQAETIRAADTFFVATASPDGAADASHRGGNPGFVQVLSPTRVRWPDYIGNAMFLTLGNLELNPAAGLFLPDWRTGSVLHLSGTASTVWDTAGVPGAQRLVDFDVAHVRQIAGAAPLHWTEPVFSRFNPPVA
jgi:predicted pyridoxine 5'-phosphate oxidase superfamily flavin-nucleotide-binding protein